MVTTALLLDVWREACRHFEISKAVAGIVPLLGRVLPLELLAVRRIDIPRSVLENVALESLGSLAGFCTPRCPCADREMSQILAWCRAGVPLRGRASEARCVVPGIIPNELTCDVAAVPLNDDGGPTGVLLLAARPGAGFGEDDEGLLAALQEPFAVALENDRRVRELASLREAAAADNRSLLSRLDRHDISDCIVGAETGLHAVMGQVELVARSNVPVLILGETGSGKEVVARAIHSRSGRCNGPFLRINCGAIPPELIGSELFGHERGSFTGAVSVRKGWFERADGGTLFLDECGELPLAAQVRLLRVLQDGSFERVGGERQQTTDVHHAATHRDLPTMVAEKAFREDLWYRIAVFPVLTAALA